MQAHYQEDSHLMMVAPHYFPYHVVHLLFTLSTSQSYIAFVLLTTEKFSSLVSQCL